MGICAYCPHFVIKGWEGTNACHDINCDSERKQRNRTYTQMTIMPYFRQTKQQAYIQPLQQKMRSICYSRLLKSLDSAVQRLRSPSPATLLYYKFCSILSRSINACIKHLIYRRNRCGCSSSCFKSETILLTTRGVNGLSLTHLFK